MTDLPEFDLEEALEADLEEEAFNFACEAATEATVAGLDHQHQLEHGIKAYVHAIQKRGTRII